MNISSTAARVAFELMHASGAATLLRPWTQGLGVIFCMHRVRPASDASFAPNANLEVTPEFLDSAIAMLKHSGFELVSMDEVVNRLAQGRAADKPFAAFTLDDGYRDNFEHALPVFTKHDCPFTIYVAPGLVDGTTEMWWVALEKIIASCTQLSVDIAGQQSHHNMPTAALKQSAWQKLARQVDQLPEYDQRQWIRTEAARHGIDLAAMCFQAIMTWAEIRKVSRHRLATIGAHTINHHAIKQLPAEDALREMSLSRQRIELELKLPVRHFAFPYGNRAHAGPRDFQLAKEAGFASSATTRLGTVFPGHAHHLQALPRVMVSGKYQQARWLQVLATGLPGMLRNAGRRTNVGD